MAKRAAFDLVVIGAGAAGSTVASAGAERGYRVALIEANRVGGTCLNSGCDPTKTLAHAARLAHLARGAGRYGVQSGEVRIDWPAVRGRVHEVIDTIRGGDGERNLRDQGITLVTDRGRFVDRETVIAGDDRIAGERFLIATGARVAMPEISGLERVGYLCSEDIPALETLPLSLAIVGAGPVGVEFAQIFARLGVEVTLIGTRDLPLPREEPDLRAALLDALRQDGVRWEPRLRIARARRRAGQKVLDGQRDGEPVEVTAAEILIATGRVPNVGGLGLEDAGVHATDHGIVVNPHLETTNPAIYAAGDVTGIYPFTHVADYQARIVEHNLFEDDPPLRADYRVVPWVTYTDPELARVGLTAEEATAGGYDAAVATMPFADLPRAMITGEQAGLVRLVIDRAERTILGGHILGAHAGELISGIALAMQQGLPVDALAATMHPYPTMAEGVFWAAWQAVSDLLEAPMRVAARQAAR